MTDPRGVFDGGFERLGSLIGRSRFIVIVPVLAVLLVAMSLFLLGALQAGVGVWQAWAGVLGDGHAMPDVSGTFLDTVILILEAVVFFLIAVGLFSLFVAPLNLAVALGVETFHDLEERVTSVVVAVLAVTFLEHFIRWEDPRETMQFGIALAVTVSALVLFQHAVHRSREDQKAHKPDAQARSREDLFEGKEERHSIRPEGGETPARRGMRDRTPASHGEDR